MDRTVISLISAGIDSPVAAHLMAEAGADVKLLNLDTRPFTDDSTIKAVETLIERLKEEHMDIEAYRASFRDIHRAILDNVDERYRCIACRRMMYRAAEELLEQEGAYAISTGESLGQVASQTLSNLASEDGAVETEIFRPLIGLDKNETISIAKEIGTYDISTQSAVRCLITPDRPMVNSESKDVKEEEENIPTKYVLEDLFFEKI